ncbi:hypothetical protein GW755_01180 [bacterium]|nr:hypothetical protein [bacterium]
MDHVAILRKSNIKKGDDLLGNILAGNKTIESRWYVNKVAPWGKIFKGDTVYFKESGCAITAKSKVKSVSQYSSLNENVIVQIIKNYGRQIAPDTLSKEFLAWGKKQSNKKYCILIFLEKVKKVEPFNINKTGFGSSAAWLCVENIDKVKIKNP